MVHSDAFWNDILEKQRNISTRSLFKACIQRLFKTNWNCKESFENKDAVKPAFWNDTLNANKNNDTYMYTVWKHA